MKKPSKAKTILFVLLCLPFCGAWTAATADETPCDVIYGGTEIYTLSTYATAPIRYTEKTVTMDTSLDHGIADYTVEDLAMTGACGAVAGATALALYDTVCPQLIPNWDARNGDGSYKTFSYTYVKPVATELNTLMGGPGVTEDGFKQGLTSYVTGKGYTCNLTSVSPGGVFDYELYKAKIAAGYPVALLMPPCVLYSITPMTSTVDFLNSTQVSDNHIMIAYGTYSVTYKTARGTEVHTFLKVASGLDGHHLTMYGVHLDQLTAVYSIEISA